MKFVSDTQDSVELSKSQSSSDLGSVSRWINWISPEHRPQSSGDLQLLPCSVRTVWTLRNLALPLVGDGVSELPETSFSLMSHQDLLRSSCCDQIRYETLLIPDGK